MLAWGSTPLLLAGPLSNAKTARSRDVDMLIPMQGKQKKRVSGGRLRWVGVGGGARAGGRGPWRAGGRRAGPAGGLGLAGGGRNSSFICFLDI